MSAIVPEKGFAETCAGLAEEAGRVSEATAAETKSLIYPDREEALSSYLDLEYRQIRAAWRRSPPGHAKGNAATLS